ncbi:VOC family protein [Pseudonocardia sp. T1-2H]|uniref:VOC family protein n=1 Tax=Pseudonocardia sp. T1-2H TaxID=3128899 RepID=UPI003100BA72
MEYSPALVCLPIADRPRSFAFYRDGLGLDAFGEPADDGVPEPLQFAVNAGLNLMLIPTGGFGWVIGDREVAKPGQTECVLTLGVGSPTDVDELVERAAAAGAIVVTPPGQQPWGYEGSFADPDGHLWQVHAQG